MDFSRRVVGTAPEPSDTRQSMGASGQIRRASASASAAGLFAVAAPSWNLRAPQDHVMMDCQVLLPFAKARTVPLLPWASQLVNYEQIPLLQPSLAAAACMQGQAGSQQGCAQGQAGEQTWYAGEQKGHKGARLSGPHLKSSR